jgi:HPt (histidine-containing phosphotransfer) domain-containing protein
VAHPFAKTQEARMIDWARVSELRDEIGGDDFAEVVALFLEEADEVVARLPACSDAKSLESALHFLKGAALNLGFRALAQLCQEGERLAASGDCAVDTIAVVAAYEGCKTAFDAGLATLGDTRAA